MYGITPDELRKLYLGALWTITRFGWIRGSAGDRSTGFCVVGAVYEYYQEYQPRYGTCNVALRYLEHLAGTSDMVRWNDSHLSSLEKVKELLLSGAETADRGLELFGSYRWN